MMQSLSKTPSGELAGFARKGRNVALIAAAGASLALSACSASTAAPTSDPDAVVDLQTTTMSLTGTHWREIIAQEKGFFEKQGLNVEEALVKPDITVATLLSGDAKISFADAASTVQAIEKGANLSIVGSGMDRANYSFVVAADIKTIADLRGKTVGAAGETDSYTGIIFEMLADAGLGPDDVDVIYGSSSSDRVTSLEGGAIQAALIPPPKDQSLVAAGFHILAKSQDYVDLLSLSVTAVDKTWAAENADTVKKYLQAISDATDWLYEPANKDEAVEILARVTDTSVEASTAAYDEYIRGEAFNLGACVQPAAAQELLDRQKAAGVMKDTDVDNYVDAEYCPN